MKPKEMVISPTRPLQETRDARGRTTGGQTTEGRGRDGGYVNGASLVAVRVRSFVLSVCRSDPRSSPGLGARQTGPAATTGKPGFRSSFAKERQK